MPSVCSARGDEVRCALNHQARPRVEPAGADRIEGDIGLPGGAQQILEALVEIDVNQPILFGPHGPVVRLVSLPGPHRELAITAGTDFWRRSLTQVPIGRDGLEAGSRRGERVGEEDDVLALVAQHTQPLDQRFEVGVDLVEPSDGNQSD